MKCTLYITNSPYNKLEKTLSQSSELDCKINRAIQWTDLVLRVECKTDFIYNYCFFNGRYYFINEINAVSANVYDITLHIDVLMTYANDIKNTMATSDIAENYNHYNNGAKLTNDVRYDTEKIEYENPFNSNGVYIMTTMYQPTNSK